MGEIVIRIPANKNRRYILDDPASVDRLIETLDKAAVRVKANPTKDDLEFAEDLRDVRKAIDGFRRTGKTDKWEDVKASLGL